MSTKTRIGRGVTVALVVAVAAAVLAGCGSKASSLAATPTPSASPTASQGSLAQLAALAGYLGQVKPIATQLGAAVTALPDAVKGLAKKPDGTWNASATRLKAISAQLSADAASLAALTPPDVLRPVQDAAVKAISDAQSAVTKTAVALDKGVAKRGATSAKIQSQIAALQGQLSQVGQRLLGAVEGMIASPNSTPTP
jgi:hypothetical protein